MSTQKYMITKKKKQLYIDREILLIVRVCTC